MRTFLFAPSARARIAHLIVLGGLTAAHPASADPLAGQTSSIASNGAATLRADPPRRKLTIREMQARLGQGDRLAALKALHIALSEISDGATFVWRKKSRNLTGVIKPNSAFRNASGQVCRHVIYMLALGRYRKQIEGIACRGISGRWTLSG